MADSESESDIHELLHLQVSEIEILQSMFVEGKELNVDIASLSEIKGFLSGSGNIPNRLEFTLKLFDNLKCEDYLEVTCCVPLLYPRETPEVFVNSSSLTREIHKELNDSTSEFLKTLEPGELCLVTIIQWLREIWPGFFERSVQIIRCREGEISKPTSTKVEKHEEHLSRVWLYMHHIYSKTKRKHILDWAKESKLTGFSLPGKPGVICIEGDSADTEDYFSRLRRLNWKKITCRHKEENIEQRKFEDFKELDFHGGGNDRMDFGEFFYFLVRHNLREMFKMLFGIEGN